MPPTPPIAPLHPEHPGYLALAEIGMFARLQERAGSELISHANVLDEVAANPTLFDAVQATSGVHGYDRRMPGHDRPALDRAAAFVAAEWSAVANWHGQGRRAFIFSAPLVGLLQRTDFDVPRGYVQLPFPCVYYRWLDSGLTLHDDADGTDEPVQGAYVFFEQRRLLEPQQGLAPGVHRLLRVFVTAHPRNAIYFHLLWDDPEQPVCTEDVALRGLPAAYLPIANLVINSTLYLSSPEAETRQELAPRREIDAAMQRTRNPKKLRRLDRERNRVTGTDYVYVGASIPAASVGAHGKLLTHHWVRGHWKQQPHGTGRAERRLLWVKPYERGKDLAEQVAKKYKVR